MVQKTSIKKLLSRPLYLDVKSVVVLVAFVFTAGYFSAAGKQKRNSIDNTYPLPQQYSSSSSLVNYGDKIFTKDSADWEQSPIVVPEYRLVIFTSAKVGCTVFKMLARRMSGFSDYNTALKDNRAFVWHPERNGLTYLYHLDISTANEAMTSPNWTRAIFVRDPKTRFLSAYLDKAKSETGFINRRCCPELYNCEKPARPTLDAFFRLASKCKDAHWVPQTQKMEAKYWDYINFVGHIETAQQDAELLLRKVGMGAWEKFGESGWGVDGNSPIFSDNKKGSAGTHHAKNADKKLRKYYTPEVESLVEQFYKGDYENPVLQLEKTNIFA